MNEEALADVAFLAASVNRVRAFDVLTDGPHDRYELKEALDISRVTARRILDDFETRGWVIREKHEYRTTPLGEVVMAALRELLSAVETMQTLAPVIRWLPEDFDVDPRRLADARVTLTSWSDSAAPIRRAAEATEGSQRVRVAGSGIAPTVIRAMRDAAVDGADLEVVMTAEALDVLLASPELSSWCREMVEAGAEFARHEEGFEYLLGVCDDTAVIGMNDESGAPRGLIESADEAVREWTESSIDRCLAGAEPLPVDAFNE